MSNRRAAVILEEMGRAYAAEGERWFTRFEDLRHTPGRWELVRNDSPDGTLVSDDHMTVRGLDARTSAQAQAVLEDARALAGMGAALTTLATRLKGAGAALAAARGFDAARRKDAIKNNTGYEPPMSDRNLETVGPFVIAGAIEALKFLVEQGGDR